MLTDCPPGTGGAERVDAQVFFVDLDFDVVGFGQHSHRDCGSVDPSAAFGCRNALNPVHAALVLELAVHALAFDHRDDFLEPAHSGSAGGDDFDPPALRFGIARIHAEEFLGKQGGFVATRAGADLQQHVLFVVGVFRNQENLEVGFDGDEPVLPSAQALPEPAS